MVDIIEVKGYKLLRFYGILKKDVHTLLVKRSKNPIDYKGRIDFYENIAHLYYEAAFDSTFTFIQSMIKHNWYSVLNDMIRRDVQLWDKNQDITNTSLVFDLSRERVSFTVYYKKNIIKL